MPNVEEILTLKQQLAGADSTRHSEYDVTLDATKGNYYDRVMNSTWKKWQGIIYEPGIPGSDKKQVHIVINLLNPIVEAKRALWSVMPEIRVPYKSLDAADIQMTDSLETVYRSLWNENRMGEKLGDGGWYAALLGTAVFCVYPDFVAHRPRIIARSPYGFYGVPGNIEQDGTVWEKVVFVTKMRGRQANTMWPGCGAPDDDLVDVVEYWDKEMKCTIIEQVAKMVDGPVVNKVGVVTVVTVPNIAQPGQWWGKDDVGDAIPLVNELNKRFNVENQAFSDQAGAPWEAVNLDQELEDVSLDPDAVNNFGPGGGLKKSATGGLPWQIYQSNQQVRQYIDAVTDFPEVMRSMFGGSNISGKAINNMMGPIQARMELRQRYLFPRLEVLNKYAMTTWAKYWGGEMQIIRGSIKGKRYNLEMKMNDFEGYYENEVYLDSSAYFDVQSKVVVGLQMIAANGLSLKTFGQKLNPFVDDWTQEEAQIKKEQMDRIELAMQAQMMAQNPMGVNPDVGVPAQDQRNLMRGVETGPSAQQPPPGVNPDILGQGLSQAGLMGNELAPQGQESPLTGAMGAGGETTPLEAGGMGMLTSVADAIRSVPNITGRVFLTGSILEGSIGPEGVEIWFTDMVDWATVRQAVSKQVPEVKGQFNPQQGVPNVEFLEVTPGTTGYDPQPPESLSEEGLEAIPGGAMPPGGTPEMMAGGAEMPMAPPPPTGLGR